MSTKKIFAVTLAGLMAASLCACGSDQSDIDPETISPSGPSISSDSTVPGTETPNADLADYVTAPESAFSWEEVEGGVRITKYTGNEKYIIIPAQLGGQDVLQLGSGAFLTDSVVGVKLPDTLEVIKPNAFSGSDALVTVVMGKNVKRLDDEAFKWCANLSEVVLNQGLQEIGVDAFLKCQSLAHLELPDSLKSIERSAFGFAGLEEIEIPGRVKQIGKQAFYGCKNMKTAILHEGIETLNSGIFTSCDNLERVELAASIKNLDSDIFEDCDHVVVSLYPGSAAEEFAKEHDYKIELKTTAPEAPPEEETEPEKVRNYTQPEESDFIVEEAENGVAIKKYTGKYKNVIIPSTLGGKNVVALKKLSFSGEHVEGIKIPDTVTELDEQFLYYCKNLSEVEFGTGLKVIPSNAFEGCRNLINVVLKDGLEVIGMAAFSHCTNLKSITLPNTLTEIGASAFTATSLEQVTIPGSVKVIGEKAFLETESLKTVVVEEGVQQIKQDAFRFCSSLERIELPASLTEIENFLGWDSDTVACVPSGSKVEEVAKQYNYKMEVK